MFFNTSRAIVFLFHWYLYNEMHSLIVFFLWTVIPNVKEEDNYVGIPTRINKFQNVCPKQLYLPTFFLSVPNIDDLYSHIYSYYPLIYGLLIV